MNSQTKQKKSITKQKKSIIHFEVPTDQRTKWVKQASGQKLVQWIIETLDSAVPARKHSVTGIKHLSLGHTKNRGGSISTRYSVNHIENSRNICKSFYFQCSESQKNEFLRAVEYMKDHDLFCESIDVAKAIYIIKDHERLI